jgi:mannose-6-phosphate isomerase-like protein (cupin superfamily)
MALPTFAEFEAEARAAGFHEVLSRSWPADQVLSGHRHDFAVSAVVTQGEMWLTVDGRTQHLRRGERFTLDAGVEHAERYGPGGATCWVARRYPSR